MQVRALRMGQYDLKRIKPDQVFEMKDSDFWKTDKKGNPILIRKENEVGEVIETQTHTTWVEAVEEVPETKIVTKHVATGGVRKIKPNQPMNQK